MTITQGVFLFFLSGLASLDRLAGFNIMLSRPLVVSGLIGFLFGNLNVCLMVGIIFELVGMLEVPVGTTVTHDDTFAGYASSLLVALGAASDNALSLLICISITVVFMYIVTISDRYVRSFNRSLIIINTKKHSHDFESRLIGYGVVVAFFRGVLVYNGATFIILIILNYINKIEFTSYMPYVSILMLSSFLGGYLMRFLSLDIFYKLILVSLGLFFGWFAL